MSEGRARQQRGCDGIVHRVAYLPRGTCYLAPRDLDSARLRPFAVSLDQARLATATRRKPPLAAPSLHHPFMIVARQMKHSMQGQNLDFLGGGMTQPARILRGDFRRNGDVSGATVFRTGSGTGSGNESTSVGLSFPRKRRLSVRNSGLPVSSTLTVARKLLAGWHAPRTWPKRCRSILPPACEDNQVSSRSLRILASFA